MRKTLLLTSLFWAVAGALSVVALLPYVLALLPSYRSAIAQSGLPLPAIVALQALQAGVFLFGMTFLGLWLGRPLHLGSPLVEARFGGPPAASSGRTLALAAVSGAGIGAVVVALDLLWLRPLLPEASPGIVLEVARWRGFLASFYGGIVEELQCRALLVTALARLLVAIRVSRRTALGAAVLAAALAFGAAHLPAAAQIWPLTPIVVARVLALNALVGVTAGALYVKYGLEHAIAAHFCADLILHVVAG